MKLGKFGQKLKASIRKHYVRKKDFEALTKEVNRMSKKLAKLEKCCEPTKSNKQDTKTKSRKTEKKALKTTAPVVEAKQDKLTDIRGIGPVLEKKLHGLGITQFSHIAGWNEEDVERVSEHLSFKGRIQREGWIEQAKGLAS